MTLLKLYMGLYHNQIVKLDNILLSMKVIAMTIHSMLLNNSNAASTLANYTDNDSSKLLLLFKIASGDETNARPGYLLRQVRADLEDSHCALSTLLDTTKSLLSSRRLRAREVAVVSRHLDGNVPLINYDVTAQTLRGSPISTRQSSPIIKSLVGGGDSGSARGQASMVPHV